MVGYIKNSGVPPDRQMIVAPFGIKLAVEEQAQLWTVLKVLVGAKGDEAQVLNTLKQIKAAKTNVNAGKPPTSATKPPRKRKGPST